MEGLWNALRSSGQESLAPLLLRHGVRSVAAVQLQSSELIEAGVQPWQVEAILVGCTQQAVAPAVGLRRDLPAPISGKRADLVAALEAAMPNQRGFAHTWQFATRGIWSLGRCLRGTFEPLQRVSSTVATIALLSISKRCAAINNGLCKQWYLP